jgi:intracellular sulfur oxidation DsrE/DsrF family protein
MHVLKTLAATTAIVVTLAGCAATPSSAGREKVVYHLNQGNEQATDGLRNIRNQLSVNKDAKIVVVTHARGIDFLMKGAQDRNGNPFQVTVEQLKEQGVEFRICEITLQGRGLRRDQFIEEASFVPSGVGEVTRLQQREGFAYLKP